MNAAMALQHPIDSEIRARLKALKPNHAEFASAIGRSGGWLNKYIHGTGKATIDDVVRIAALLIGATAATPLTAMERRLLKAWRQIPQDRREDAVSVLETVARGYRRSLSQGSDGPAVRTPSATTNRGRGKR